MEKYGGVDPRLLKCDSFALLPGKTPCAYCIESCLLLLLLLLFTAIEFSLGGSSPFTSTAKTNKNKYT
jgi:hypothetical protein